MKKCAEKNLKIFVDADACPVKTEILQIANTHEIEVHFIASYAHAVSNEIGGAWIYVDSYKESVDLYIMNRAKKYDVVITHDVGLASILVKKGVIVLSPRGKLFTETEMDTALHIRYAMAKERRNGHYSKGPKPFSSYDRLYFTKRLHQILSNLAGKIN